MEISIKTNNSYNLNSITRSYILYIDGRAIREFFTIELLLLKINEILLNDEKLNNNKIKNG